MLGYLLVDLEKQLAWLRGDGMERSGMLVSCQNGLPVGWKWQRWINEGGRHKELEGDQCIKGRTTRFCKEGGFPSII